MFEKNEIIESVLLEHKNSLKQDFNKYRNHVYSVYYLCLELDSKESNQEKYAIASVFHDIGIWTQNTFDYLDPSIVLVKKYLKIIEKESLQEEISLMISMHHKITKYDGVFQKTVEVFRRADWIMVTKKIFKFNISEEKIKAINNEFPSLGFHRFLAKQTFKQLFKNPLKPLPMFKK